MEDQPPSPPPDAPDEFEILGDKPVKLKFQHPEDREMEVEMPAREAARHVHRYISSLDRLKKVMASK